MSVHGRTAIVAVIITLLLIPVGNAKHPHYKVVRRSVAHLACTKGKPIPSSLAAKRLHVVGRICTKQIVVRLYAATGKG